MRAKSSKKINFLWIVIPLISAFLFLPFISPEDSSLGQSSEATEEAGSLPVIISENPLSKYLKKLSSFYGFKKFSKKHNNSADVQNSVCYDGNDADSPGAGDVLSSFGSGVESDSQDMVTAGVTENSVYRASDGTPISPDKAGYYYGDKYYANGEYPDTKLKKSIESSINKFHAKVAAKEGKKAAYVVKDDGRMVVEYLTNDFINNYQNSLNAPVSSDIPNIYASADRYNGARVASRDGGDFSSGGSAAGSNSDAGIMGDFSDKIGEVNYKLVNSAPASDTNNATETPQKKPPLTEKDKSDIIISSAGVFRGTRFSEPNPDAPFPPYDPEKFKNATILVDRMMMGYLRNLKIGLDSFPAGKLMSFEEAEKNGRDIFVENKKLKNPLKIFPAYDIAKVQENLHPVLHNPDVPIFFNYPRVPYTDPSTIKTGGEKLSDVFYERTGLGRILNEMDIPVEKRDSIKAEYLALDKKREENKALVIDMIANNPNLKKVNPGIIFVLGKDEKSGNMMVASPKSYLYTLSPMPSAWVTEKYKQEPLAYMPVSAAEIASNISKPGNVVVVTSPQEEFAMKQAGANTVVIISERQLASPSPESIKNNLHAIGAGVMKEMNRTSSEVDKKQIKSILDKKAAVAKAANDAIKKATDKKDIAKAVPQKGAPGGMLLRPDPNEKKESFGYTFPYYNGKGKK